MFLKNGTVAMWSLCRHTRCLTSCSTLYRMLSYKIGIDIVQVDCVCSIGICWLRFYERPCDMVVIRLLVAGNISTETCDGSGYIYVSLLIM